MVTKVEDKEMQTQTFVLTRSRIPAEGSGQFELAAAGKHPKCKLISGQVTPLIYSTAADAVAIEHEDGGNVATATTGTTIGTPVALTIAPAAGYSAVFERNEPIIEATAQGNNANATQIIAVFETMD